MPMNVRVVGEISQRPSFLALIAILDKSQLVDRMVSQGDPYHVSLSTSMLQLCSHIMHFERRGNSPSLGLWRNRAGGCGSSPKSSDT